MSINNYDGETFVAFFDISGFKQLMHDEKKAWKALDKLYSCGYETLRRRDNELRVEGIFISDCGVLFTRTHNGSTPTISESLKKLLKVIKNINRRMADHDFLLTTSIAYGKFRYQERVEFEGIEKNPIYGNAYVSAFLDNENGKPKIQPAQCRIVKKNLPGNINQNIKHGYYTDDVFRMIREKRGDDKHYYFYWMVNNSEEINQFEQKYKDAYNLKYAGILKAVKGNGHRHGTR